MSIVPVAILEAGQSVECAMGSRMTPPSKTGRRLSIPLCLSHVPVQPVVQIQSVENQSRLP